jgi:hypothetical protein
VGEQGGDGEEVAGRVAEEVAEEVVELAAD